MTEIILALINQYPIVGVVMVILGGIFVILELAIDATPGKRDDVWWKSIKKGYFGKLIEFSKSLFLSRK